VRVRLASLLYESVLLVPVLFVAALPFLLLTHDAASRWMKPLFQLWLLAVLGLYFGYCWVKGGQTLAMKAWRIRVQRADGAALSWRQALLRFVLACWTLAPAGLGLLWALVDRDRQFLHDRLAGTRIVRLVSGAPGGR
jgi:uncharacterized RDD family membrane protein YckC